MELTDANHAAVDQTNGFSLFLGRCQQAHAAGGRLVILGNGGSAGLASHQAFDWWRNGRIRAVAFNDPSLLTGGANDFGYPQAFAEAFKMHATPHDVLVAVSSSGQSPNILNASSVARELGNFVMTLSAFKPDNPLRGLGDLNLYLPTDRYGYAELGHELVLHSLLDFMIDWRKP